MRTLPLRVQPVQGEALDSWLETLCIRMHTTWGDLLGSIGLPSIATRRWSSGILTGLTPGEAAVAQTATGVSASVLQSMTLDPVERIVMARSTLPRSSISAMLWLRSRRARFCPECLRENGGRWYLWWRLRWAFACLRHACLLVDLCPDCGRPQRTEPTPTDLVPIPMGCTRKLVGAHGRDIRRCCGSLGESNAIAIPSEHPALSAQRGILHALAAGSAAHGIYADSPVSVATLIADLAAVARRLLTYASPERVARTLSEELAIDSSAGPSDTWHKGVTAEASSVWTASAVTASWGIVEANSIVTAGDRLRWLVESCRRQGRTVRGTSVGWGRGISSALVGAQLAALGPFMAPGDQLRYRLHTTLPRRTVHGLAQRRAALVPTMLWPQWSLRMRCSGIGQLQSRPALSAAVLLVGSTVTLSDAARLLGFTTDARAVSRVLQQLQRSPHGTSAFSMISNLAAVLDAHGSPIDYSRRRALDCSKLLSEDAWQLLCFKAGVAPGRGLRHQLAQCWLYERLTGCPAQRSPWAQDNPRFRTSLADLPLWFTADVVALIDEYAEHYLHEHGVVDEPVTWCPDVGPASRSLLDPNSPEDERRCPIGQNAGQDCPVAGGRVIDRDLRRFLAECKPAQPVTVLPLTAAARG